MIGWFRRLAWLLGRRRFEAELGEEIRLHEELAAEQARHEGMTPADAEFAARRRVGNRAQLGEAARDVWRPPALGDLGQDLRYAVRGLARQPGYAAAIAVTLMLAIGATTALFSVLDALLLRPLPYREADRLVQVWEHRRTSDNRENLVSPANFLDWRDRARSFEHLAAYTWSSLGLIGNTPAVVYGRMVTSNFFSVMGTRPSLGRGFLPGDTLPGAPRALILSHAVWATRFGGDSAVLGQPVALREGSARIVGVMPREFRPLGGEEYWEPWPMQDDLRVRRGRYAMAVGRLRAGGAAEDADRELGSIAAALEQEHPKFNAAWGTRVVSLEEQVTGKARPVLLFLAGAIASVLLIACLNVANLRLGQVLARRTELAVRTALGASRARIIRQLLAEGLVLAAIGGALGIVAAMAGVRALVAAQVTQIPRLEEVTVNLRVLVFAVGLIALIGMAFGLAPALALREDALRQPLSRRGGETGSAPRARRLRGALVSVQVALSLMLLAGASLSVRSLGKLLAVNPGFEHGGVLTVALELPEEAYGAPGRKVAFYETLAQRVRGIPGITAVGLVNFLPLRGFTPGTGFQVVGRPEPAPGQAPTTQLIVADPGYHEAMGTPIVRGRGLTPADQLGAPRVILINQAFARRAFPGADPVGQRVKVAYADPDSVLSIVGVVADMRRDGIDVAPAPMVVSSHRPTTAPPHPQPGADGGVSASPVSIRLHDPGGAEQP